MIPFLRNLLTHRREVSILRASLSRVAAERDAALADRARAEDSAVRAFRRRLCLALYGAENMAGTMDELLSRVEHIASEVCTARAEREQYAGGLTIIARLFDLPSTATATEIAEVAYLLTTWRSAVCDLLAIPRTSSIEDVREEIEPEGWPEWWDAFDAPALIAISCSGGEYHISVSGPYRPDDATALRDARAFAATLARRMRQEKL